MSALQAVLSVFEHPFGGRGDRLIRMKGDGAMREGMTEEEPGMAEEDEVYGEHAEDYEQRGESCFRERFQSGLSAVNRPVSWHLCKIDDSNWS